MANKIKQVWVSPSNDGWRVHSARSERDAGIYETKSEAVERAREIAQNKRAELIVQNADGVIGWRDSEGNDPFPPRG